jgi:hypothetical protein
MEPKEITKNQWDKKLLLWKNKQIFSQSNQKKERLKLIKLEIGDITTENTEIQRIIREFIKSIYSNELKNIQKC